jgi:hypothetical protein
MAMGLRDVAAIDDTITTAEAEKLAASLASGVASIRKLIKMLRAVEATHHHFPYPSPRDGYDKSDTSVNDSATPVPAAGE